MFGRTSASQERIEELLVSLQDLIATWPRPGTSGEETPGLARLQALELRQAKWEAEMEALVMKAEGKYRAASASEVRERTQRRAYEKIAEEFDPPSEETLEELEAREAYYDFRDGNAEGGPGDGVQPLHLGVEDGDDPKARALRGKFS